MNENLHKAKRMKKDEYYTAMNEIEAELSNYGFKGKKVYLPCDDYRKSNFWRYFYDNFDKLGLESLTTTNYNNGEGAFSAVYDGFSLKVEPLYGDGDFRSSEAEFLKGECDVIVTNPPFSLFRQFVDWLGDKPFIVIGNKLAFTYHNVIEQVMHNKVWSGCRSFNGDMWFYDPDGELVNVGGCWITNVDHSRRHIPMELSACYSPERYCKYDNADAIDIKRLKDIPKDYDGVMGVPLTFLNKYCPEQFEFVGYLYGEDGRHLQLDGKEAFFRILVKKRPAC